MNTTCTVISAGGRPAIIVAAAISRVQHNSLLRTFALATVAAVFRTFKTTLHKASVSGGSTGGGRKGRSPHPARRLLTEKKSTIF